MTKAAQDDNGVKLPTVFHPNSMVQGTLSGASSVLITLSGSPVNVVELIATAPLHWKATSSGGSAASTDIYLCANVPRLYSIPAGKTHIAIVGVGTAGRLYVNELR